MKIISNEQFNKDKVVFGFVGALIIAGCFLVGGIAGLSLASIIIGVVISIGGVIGLVRAVNSGGRLSAVLVGFGDSAWAFGLVIAIGTFFNRDNLQIVAVSVFLFVVFAAFFFYAKIKQRK